MADGTLGEAPSGGGPQQQDSENEESEVSLMHASQWKRGFCLAAVLSLAGCASPSVERTAQPLPDGGQRVAIELSSFAFAPNVVRVRAGVPLTIDAVSKSGIAHNLTILSLDQAAALKSVDVAANQTVTFQATLLRPGRYVFYCDKPLHRPLGMEGKLLAQ